MAGGAGVTVLIVAGAGDAGLAATLASLRQQRGAAWHAAVLRTGASVAPAATADGLKADAVAAGGVTAGGATAGAVKTDAVKTDAVKAGGLTADAVAADGAKAEGATAGGAAPGRPPSGAPDAPPPAGARAAEAPRGDAIGEAVDAAGRGRPVVLLRAGETLSATALRALTAQAPGRGLLFRPSHAASPAPDAMPPDGDAGWRAFGASDGRRAAPQAQRHDASMAPSTDRPRESRADLETQAATDPVTDAARDAVTEPVAYGAGDSATDAAANAVAKAATEAAPDAASEAATDAAKDAPRTGPTHKDRDTDTTTTTTDTDAATATATATAANTGADADADTNAEAEAEEKTDRRAEAGAEATAARRSTAAAVLACWLSALEAGAGRDGRAWAARCFADLRAPGAAGRVHDAEAPAPELLVDALLDGLAWGTGARTEAALLPQWDVFWPRLRPALEALEAACVRPGLLRRLASRLERRLLPERLERPLVLETTLALPLDPAALAPIDPPSGPDTLLVEFLDANGAPRRLERPLWGRVAAHELAELLEEVLGAEGLVRRGGFERHAGYRLTYRLAVLRSTLRALPDRLSLDAQRRARARPHRPGHRHWAALQWLRRREPPGVPAGSARAADIVARAGDIVLPSPAAGALEPPRGPAPRALADTPLDGPPPSSTAPVDYLPVLAYGRIVDPSTARVRAEPGDVPAAGFEAQLALLRRHGWHGVPLATVARQRDAGHPLPGRPVLIGFDGGLENFAAQAWPRLRRHGFGALVFLDDAELPRDAAARDRLRALHAEGVAFGWRPSRPAEAFGSEALLRSAAAAVAALRAALGSGCVAVAPGESSGEREWSVLALAGCGPCFQGEGRSALWDRARPLRRLRVRGDWDLACFARALRLAPAEPLVSVIVPAYDAERTVDATLDSVRAQSHRRLEILVVDDGSRDGTAARVQRHAAADPRVRLLRQANAGVAAARNRALRAARGDFVAPVDADDLWHPHKIERQLRVFEHGPAALGLVYTGYAVIDAEGRVTRCADPRLHGCVQADLMRLGNFVGNASSALIRRELALRFGYDPSLHARGAQGCEDYKLYLQLAGVCEFGVVPAPLTGYRVVDGNMSSAILTMRRSCELVRAELAAAQPSRAGLLDEGHARMLAWLAQRGLDCGRLADARILAAELAPLDAERARALRGALARAALKRLAGCGVVPRPGAPAARDARAPRPLFPVGRPV